MNRNLLLWLAAAVVWAAGRREGREAGRRDGFTDAAGIFTAGLRRGQGAGR